MCFKVKQQCTINLTKSHLPYSQGRQAIVVWLRQEYHWINIWSIPLCAPNEFTFLCNAINQDRNLQSDNICLCESSASHSKLHGHVKATISKLAATTLHACHLACMPFTYLTSNKGLSKILAHILLQGHQLISPCLTHIIGDLHLTMRS